MDEAADSERSHSERCDRKHIQHHSHEAEPNDRYRPTLQRLGGSAGLHLHKDMDKTPPEVWLHCEALHSPREHYDTDLCCGLL